MIPQLVPTFSDIATWVRSATSAVNQLIRTGDALATRATTIETAATALTGRVTAAESAATALATRVTTAETAITALQAPAKLVFTPSAAPGTPTEGTVYYDATLHKLQAWNGTAWQPFW